MNEAEIKKFALNLMNDTRVVYFTTVKDGIPYTRALENLRNKELFPTVNKIFNGHEDDLLAYFSTNTSSTKFRQIKLNPKVATYYCKSKEYHGVMLGGSIEIIQDKAIKEEIWVDGWERYYSKGITDPDYTILKLVPNHIRGWNSSNKFTLDL